MTAESTGRRAFLRGLGAAAGLAAAAAAVPEGFVRLASGLVVPEAEFEPRRRVWHVGAQLTRGEFDADGYCQVTLPDGREVVLHQSALKVERTLRLSVSMVNGWVMAG